MPATPYASRPLREQITRHLALPSGWSLFIAGARCGSIPHDSLDFEYTAGLSNTISRVRSFRISKILAGFSYFLKTMVHQLIRIRLQQESRLAPNRSNRSLMCLDRVP